MSDPRTPGSWGGFPRSGKKIDARAPQHDPNSNRPMSTMTGTNANLGTDAGAWNFMFHGPTSPISARTGEYAPAAVAGQADIAADEAFGGGTPTAATGNVGPTGATGASAAPQVPRWGVPPSSSGYDPLMTPRPFTSGGANFWSGIQRSFVNQGNPTAQDANAIARKYATPGGALSSIRYGQSNPRGRPDGVRAWG